MVDPDKLWSIRHRGGKAGDVGFKQCPDSVHAGLRCADRLPSSHVHTAFSQETVSEYAAFSDECSRMDPMSMVWAIYGSFCTTCGNNVTQLPLEKCDDGTDNSYEPDACRPNCLLPSWGDGVQDSEFCDEAASDSDDDADSIAFGSDRVRAHH